MSIGSIRVRDIARSVVGLEHDEGRLVAEAAAQIERLRPGATLADLLGDPVACVPCQIDGMPAAAVPGSDTCADHAPSSDRHVADCVGGTSMGSLAFCACSDPCCSTRAADGFLVCVCPACPGGCGMPHAAASA